MNRIAGNVSYRLASRALASASVLALTAILAAQPARAADECGAEGAGADTVTCTGASFANGITYAGSDGLSLVLNDASMVVTKGAATDGINLSGTTANDLTVTAASLTSIDGGTGSAITVNNDGNGKAAIVINGGTFTANVATGTIQAIHNSGAGDSLVTLSAGQVSNIRTVASFGLNAEIAGSATGNANALMTGGSIQTSMGSSVVGLRAAVTNAAAAGNASVVVDGGTISGAGFGVLATNSGSGLAQITVNAGSISSTGSSGARANASGTGNAVALMSGGSITSGNAFGANGLSALSNSGSAQASLTSGSITTNAGAGYGVTATSVTGSATALMSGGTVVTNIAGVMGVRAYVSGIAANTDASVTFSGGSITNNSTNTVGLYAQVAGSGAATIQLLGGASGTGGTITSVSGVQSLAVSGLSSITMDAGAITTTSTGLSASSTTGDARVSVTGGTITTSGNTAYGVYATSTAGPATVIMEGGSVTTSGTVSAGLRSLSANGLATIQMAGGTVTANGNAQGVVATNQGGAGTYNISITGGTVTGGGPGAVQGYSTTGGTITIGAGAVINANTGTSGIAISNTGTNAAATSITTAGTITGQINLQTGTASTLSITGGSIAGNIIGGGNGTLSFDLGAGNSFIYDAAYAITGVTSMAVNSGTVTLAGTSAATALALNGGTLSAGADANLAAGGTALNFNGGTLQVTGTAYTSTPRAITWGAVGGGFDIADAANIFTLGQTLASGGALTKLGAGTLVLTANNGYTGGTVISAGSLQLGNGGASGSIAGNVTNNGVLAFNRSDSLILDGAISGTGAVSQIGGGTTILTADNSYSGGTTIAAGALQIGGGGTSGSITGNVTNNAALLFNRSDAAIFGGAISGSGSVSQIGTGTTTLTGVNSYSGGTIISAGALRGAATSFGSGAITNNTALVVDQPADVIFANTLNGNGSFTKTGAGRLNYTGTGALTGATTVSAGTLAVNGSLASSTVTVQNGGALGGNGTVGATTIQSGGNIAPGNSIGTLHVNGNFSQASGSVYQVELDPNTNASDLIQVSGTATIQSGAGLNVSKYVPGDYRLGTVYTVLTSTGGRTGTYALSGETTGVSAFLGLQDSYDANNAYLTVVQTQPLTNATTTPNQQAVAGALPSSSPVATAVLNSPNLATAQSAFNQLSGQAQASAKGALVANGLYVRDVTFDRLRDSFCDPASTAPRPGCSLEGPSLWAQGFGGWGGVSGNANAAGMNHSTAGFLMGFDLPVADWRVGMFGGRSQSDLHLVGLDARGESTDFHLGGYAGTRWDNISLRLGASYSWDGITANRSVAFGTFSDQLHSVYQAGTAQGFAELGYRMAMWDIAFEPFANLAYINVRSDGFSEVGGPAALTVRADTLENLVSTLGVRPSTNLNWQGADITLRGLVGWRHTFGTIAPSSTMAFAGGSDFTITGAPIGRDAMALEAGVDFGVSDTISAGLTYGSQLSSRSTDQSMRGTIRISF